MPPHARKKLLAALPILSLTLAASALAHPQFALSTVNRYGKLVLGPGGGRIFYTVMVGDVPAHALRRAADRDGDGQLSPAEQEALGRGIAAELTAPAEGAPEPAAGRVTVTLDGKPLQLGWGPPVLNLPDARVAPLAFSCEFDAPLSFVGGPGEHTLRYEDRVTLAPIGEVELRIEEGPGVRVLAVWQGAGPAPATAAPKTLSFISQGPPRSSLSDRSISIRFVAESLRPPMLRRRSRLPLTLAGLLLGVGLAAWLVLRRRGR